MSNSYFDNRDSRHPLQSRYRKKYSGSSSFSFHSWILEHHHSSAIIDYSSVNEYCTSHYGDDYTTYFPYESKQETIYNGRTQLKNFHSSEKEMLENLGMTLLHCPSKVTRWDDVQQISNVHLPELESMLYFLFPKNNVLMHCFWNPVIRSSVHNVVASSPRGASFTHHANQGSSTIPSANVASAVHIDTDIGAYNDIGQFLSLVENNRIVPNANESFDVEACRKSIMSDKKRFAIVNFWRNILDEPVRHFPLAILATQYKAKDTPAAAAATATTLTNPTAHAFPDAFPDMTLSKWYTFPNVTKDEVIVFYQYDRLVTQPSDLWHCAISTMSTVTNDDYLSQSFQEQTVARRKSFDVRALVVLDEEITSDELDRFRSTRTNSLLTLDESACFCQQQADARR